MNFRHVGHAVERFDANHKVKGEALFPGDYNFPGQFYMKALYSTLPHAIVREVDTCEALNIEGVLAVLTARDVPYNFRGPFNEAQPLLCGPGSSNPHADRVNFVGDQVALVIARTEEIATRALEGIKVTYDALPVITNARDALKSDAPLIHPELGSNKIAGFRIRKGNIDDGFSGADVIIESEYHTPSQDHAYLQPEAAISYFDKDGILVVIGAGQHVHGDHEQVCKILNLPTEQVRVMYAAIGGGFGGRHEPQIRLNVALAVWYLHQKGIDQPVKMVWSRSENMITRHKRHPYTIRARWGATREGKIIAVEANVVADGGAYTYSSPWVLGNTFWMCVGPYEVPNIRIDSSVIFTNNLPRCAFRGFGAPQAAFVAESQMNKLAEALNIDPVELRLRNIWHEDSLMAVSTPPPKGFRIDKAIEASALAAGWINTPGGWMREGNQPLQDPNRPHIRRGIGLACGFKNVGDGGGVIRENSWSIVELHGSAEIEKVIVRHAGAELGQGAHTTLAQLAAEVLGVSLEIIQMVVSDSTQTMDSGYTSASRTIFMAGNAIKGAAEQALQKWKDENRPAIATYQFIAPPTTPFDPDTGRSVVNFSFGYAAETAEVEVDTETGEIHITNMICANDVGKAINPQIIEGQIEGSIVQGVGFTIIENFIEKDGYVLTPNFSTYLIPTTYDIPDRVKSLILENPDPLGPLGARGMGEMPIVPVAAAIVAAVHNATGVWFNEFPLTPERVLAGLGKLEPE